MRFFQSNLFNCYIDLRKKKTMYQLRRSGHFEKKNGSKFKFFKIVTDFFKMCLDFPICDQTLWTLKKMYVTIKKVGSL